jgi:hypothetical protein
MSIAHNTLILLAAHLLASCTPVAHYAGVPPVYGDVRALSEADVRAAFAAYAKFLRARPPLNKHATGMLIVGNQITYIRVLDGSKLQIHYEAHSRLPTARWVDVDRHGTQWEVGYAGLQISERDF